MAPQITTCSPIRQARRHRHRPTAETRNAAPGLGHAATTSRRSARRRRPARPFRSHQGNCLGDRPAQHLGHILQQLAGQADCLPAPPGPRCRVVSRLGILWQRRRRSSVESASAESTGCVSQRRASLLDCQSARSRLDRVPRLVGLQPRSQMTDFGDGRPLLTVDLPIDHQPAANARTNGDVEDTRRSPRPAP